MDRIKEVRIRQHLLPACSCLLGDKHTCLSSNLYSNCATSKDHLINYTVTDHNKLPPTVPLALFTILSDIKMASAAANFAKKMQALRVEADEHQAKSEELQAKVKTLEQENLAKEQEITSLTHRNQLLEAEVEKLETGVKEAKDLAGQSAQHGQQNESLQRRLQLLEEEAEEADKTLRETNDKYDTCLLHQIPTAC
jgi:DNA repair exonuclease SbcCD ATPase subunit